jgi:hypothetical protein
MRFVTILKALIICCFAISVFASFYHKPHEAFEQNLGHPWEAYDPSYFRKYQSVDDIINELNHHFKTAEINSSAYFNYAADIVRKRFYHGYSYYSMSDNPFAYLAGKLIWSHLRAIVNPDDIMKHPMAACSQQSLVLAEIFKRQGIAYREVGFDHHFTIEGYIDGSWRFFDTDLEPDFQNNRVSLNELISSNRFDTIYERIKEENPAFAGVAHPFFGKVNADLAPNAMRFYYVCKLLNSKLFLAIIYILLLLFPSFKKLIRSRKRGFIPAPSLSLEPTPAVSVGTSTITKRAKAS